MKAIIISWYIGIALLFVSALMTVSGIIACFFPGDDSRIPLLLSALLTGIVGLYPLIFVRRGKSAVASLLAQQAHNLGAVGVEDDDRDAEGEVLEVLADTEEIGRQGVVEQTPRK